MARVLWRALVLVAITATASLTAQAAPKAASAEADRLLKQLQGAGDEAIAAFLEQRIRLAWSSLESPAARLLQSRGQRDLNGLAVGDAVEDFNAALTLDPAGGELYVGRAAARAMTGAYAAAVQDIAAALAREPRNFDAWATLSKIAETHGDTAGALAAWTKLLTVDPHAPGGRDRSQALQRKLEGQPT